MPTRTPARPAASRRANHYTSNDELGALIQCYRRAKKRMAAAKLARLVEVFGKLAGGVWDKYRFPVEKDDFVQDCAVLFLKCAKNIEPDRNPFSYLSTCAINFGFKQQRKHAAEANAVGHYRADYIHDERYQTHHLPEQ